MTATTEVTTPYFHGSNSALYLGGDCCLDDRHRGGMRQRYFVKRVERMLPVSGSRTVRNPDHENVVRTWLLPQEWADI